MKRAECIKIIASRLGNRTDLNDIIGLEMDLIQDTALEGTGAFLPWFLESDELTLTATPNTEQITLPEGFLAEIEDHGFYLYDATQENPYTKLVKSDYDLMRAKYPVAGTPKEYNLSGNFLILKPTPDAAVTVKFRCYKAAPKTAAENVWLKHAPDLVVSEVGKVVAETCRCFW